MRAFTLDHLSDDNLLAGLAALVTTDRQTTAAMLAHLAEVEARGLYRPAACSSMHAYCVRVLRLSEDAASKRLRAARVARQWPQIFEAVADGRLHLSAVVMLAPHFADGTVDELIAAAAYRTKGEIEILVARLAPQPDLPEVVVPIDPMGGAEQANSSAPGRIPPALGQPPAVSDTRVKPLAPERFGLQVTISQETRDKLERAQALLRHRNPRGDLAEVIDRALDALLLTLEREKFGATSRPRAAKPRDADANPRYVSREVRRIVHARDGEQCSFVSADGVRCTERGYLEFDHSTPVALGGQPTADEVRLLCQSHNHYEAERRLGADFMREKRREARARRRAAAEGTRHGPTQPTATQPTANQPTPNQPTPSQPTPSQPTPNQPTRGQWGPDQPTPNQLTPNRRTPNQSTPDQPTPNQPTRGQATPEPLAGGYRQARRTALSSQPKPDQPTSIDIAATERVAETRAVDTAAETRAVDTAAETRAVDTAAETRAVDTAAETRAVDTAAETRAVDTAAETRAVDTAATERAAEARAVDADITLALRGMGFGAAETRRAVAGMAKDPASTFEARLRVALAVLTSARGFRCSDGELDLATSRFAAFLSCA